MIYLMVWENGAQHCVGASHHMAGIPREGEIIFLGKDMDDQAGAYKVTGVEWSTESTGGDRIPDVFLTVEPHLLREVGTKRLDQLYTAVERYRAKLRAEHTARG